MSRGICWGLDIMGYSAYNGINDISRCPMRPFEVVFYDLPGSGRKPGVEFLDGLGKKMRAKMARTIALLQDNGPELREPYSKSLGGGLFELRAKVGSDISRVLYFFYVGRTIVLTNGFVKKTRGCPPHVLETARGYRAEYLGRRRGQ